MFSVFGCVFVYLTSVSVLVWCSSHPSLRIPPGLLLVWCTVWTSLIRGMLVLKQGLMEDQKTEQSNSTEDQWWCVSTAKHLIKLLSFDRVASRWQNSLSWQSLSCGWTQWWWVSDFAVSEWVAPHSTCESAFWHHQHCSGQKRLKDRLTSLD